MGKTYDKIDFGKICTSAGCENAYDVPTLDVVSTPLLTDSVSSKKCELNNQPTWRGNICLLNGIAADKYLPVCVRH